MGESVNKTTKHSGLKCVDCVYRGCNPYYAHMEG